MSKSENGVLVKKTIINSKGKIIAGLALIFLLTLSGSLAGCISEENDSEKNDEFQDTEEEPEVVEIPDDGEGGNNGGDDNGTTEDPKPVTALQIPTSEVTTNSKWYPYDSDGVEIRFFAVKSNDGEIHVAFDACDVCYEEKKGYRQDGIQMVCNNCDQTFLIKAIGSENLKGGCWPSYLPMSIEEDNIIIKISDLEEKKYMFE
jgi:hypothetical protein